MILALMLLSLALIGVWIGSTARYCYIFNLDADRWVGRMFLPGLSLLVWFGLFLIALVGGWL